MTSSKSLQEKIAKLGPMVRGSLIQTHIRCGKPTCKCAKGEFHTAWYLSRRIEGKTRMHHIAKDQVALVQQWKKNYERLDALMEKLTDALMEKLKQEKRR
jgi:hypothetical protein